MSDLAFRCKIKSDRPFTGMNFMKLFLFFLHVTGTNSIVFSSTFAMYARIDMDQLLITSDPTKWSCLRYKRFRYLATVSIDNASTDLLPYTHTLCENVTEMVLYEQRNKYSSRNVDSTISTAAQVRSLCRLAVLSAITKLRSFSPQAKYTDRATATCRAKLVRTFADRACCVVRATDPTAVNLDFLDSKPLVFISSSSSIILKRLSGPRSRPTKKKTKLRGFSPQ
jgi:hypothetical protein